MPLSLTLACIWGLTACLLGLAPQRFHWPAAFCLIGTGIPILGFVTWQTGPIWGFVIMAAGISVLRWPVFYAGRWVRRRFLQG